MNERTKKEKHKLRGGAAACLVFFLCAACLTLSAKAAEMTQPQTATKYLVPVGHTVGIKLFARGVLVTELSEGSSPAKDCGLKTGDVIVQCNGQTIGSTEEFQAQLKATDGKSVTLRVNRAGKAIELKAVPQEAEDGAYRLGAWVRDSMAGIGTMTFYDPETGAFGALGHGITDMDTAQLMPLSSGAIMDSQVKAVKRGEQGAAGELKGDFVLTEDMGTLNTNCEYGVFGTADNLRFVESLGAAVPVATAEEVQCGDATILANVAGDTVEEYDVEISKIFSTDGTRNLLLTVKDQDLLTVTGGIVQGMSGSPILQNGKLVGAVTHVLLNDPTRGYGVLVENMLEEAGELAS